MYSVVNSDLIQTISESSFLHACDGFGADGVVCGEILFAGISHHQVVETYDASFSSEGYQLHFALVARLKADGRGGGNVQVHAEGFGTVELHVSVHFEEVEVRAYLYGSVACVSYRNLHRFSVQVIFYGRFCQYHASYRYGLGECCLFILHKGSGFG